MNQSGTSLRILIVDDNPQDRGLVARQLRKEYPDAEFHEAIDQAQLDDQLAAGGFDFVITDFQLLWTDGLRVLNAVKKQWPNCPVIMFTATGSEEVAVEAMKNGLDDYIIKDVKHLARLRGAVRGALQRAATEQRANRLARELDALLSQLKVGVYRRREDGTLDEVNDAFLQICDHRSDQEPLNLFALLENGTSIRQLAGERLKSEDRFECEAKLLLSDGRVAWVSISESIQRRDDQPVLVGLVEDITRRKTAEESLQQSQAAMTHLARLSTLGEIVAGIAHEIAQPLNAIANFSSASQHSLAKVQDDRLNEVREWTQTINQQSLRAAEILRGLQRFTEKRGPRCEKSSIREVLHGLADLVAFDLRERSTRLELDIESTPATLEVDRIQIQQVLVNLVRNACEAMTNVAPKARLVTLSVHERDGWVQFTVADAGSGIDEKTQDSIFQPFVTTKPEGMGMGLAISSTIVKAHGGRLSVRNEVQGAVFSFELPVDDESRT